MLSQNYFINSLTVNEAVNETVFSPRLLVSGFLHSTVWPDLVGVFIIQNKIDGGTV